MRNGATSGNIGRVVGHLVLDEQAGSPSADILEDAKAVVMERREP